jgi:predicted ferric reductase
MIALPTLASPPVPKRPTRRGFGPADLLGPLAIFSVVAVVCLWLADQGLASLGGLDRAIGSLGLLTGLLASDLMLLQVVLLARIPWVERAWGHDLLVRRHRLLGFASFGSMIAHVALYAVERLGRDGGSALSRLWAVFVTDSWMLFATVGTLLVIGVTITSIRYARRKLRYESWHLLHLYAYLGIAFALPHQIADGADFHTTYAQIYWWSLYLFSLGTILVYRVGWPLWRSLYHRMRVESVRPEIPGVISVTVRGHRLDRLRTRSGQFFVWRFFDGPGWSRGNPYTISAAPQPDRLRITIQAAGDGSARAARLRPGTRVFIEGPYGTMTAERRRHPRMLLMAAGVGITPIRALLEDSPYAPGETTLIYRYTEDEHAVLTTEIDDIAARRGVRVRYIAGPRRADGSWQPAGAHRLDDAEALSRLVPDLGHHDTFVCGPPQWTTAARKALYRAGVARDQVHTEDFAW